MFNIGLDGADEFGHVWEHAAFDRVVAQVAEESLDHVQPGSAGRREVHMEPRVPLEPGLDLRVLVSGVVVDDQMQIELGRGFAFDLAQELQPLLVPMPRQALADHGTVQRIEGRKQRGRSVALVVMRERLRAAPLQRQPRLGAIERLDLALLVAAQDRAHARAD